jgi:hypothetical protein
VRELKEAEIQKAIIDLLQYKRFVVFKQGNVGIWKQDTERYIPLSAGEKGISDIIACSPKGVFWAIEVKKPGGTASSEQLAFLIRVRANNGVAILAYSVDDVIAKL